MPVLVRFGPDIQVSVFGIYLITVLSGAILTSSSTLAPWYGAQVSLWTYGILLIVYLLVLVLIALFAAVYRIGHSASPSLIALVGPSIVAAIGTGVAAIMLPASDGFLQTNYRLNTTVVLTLSYWILGLALYAAAAVAYVVRHP